MRGLVLTAALFFPLGARADEAADALAKQKATAAELWKKMNLEKPTPPVETANLLVYGTLPEARVKTIAATLERQYVAAAKALEYTATDRPWPGKLAVYLIPDRTDFSSFLRHAEKRSPAADEGGSVSASIETPHLVVGVARGEKANPEQDAAVLLCTTLLKKRVNGDPPDWFVGGFVEATVYRATTASRAVNPAFRTKRVLGVALKELWGEALAPEPKAEYAALIVDYLAYGPASDKFVSVATALKSADTGGSGTIDEALASVQLNQAALELYAKKWAKPPVAKMPPKP